MNVGVNPARQDRQLREIVGNRALRGAPAYTRNLSPFDDNDGVAQGFPSATR